MRRQAKRKIMAQLYGWGMKSLTGGKFTRPQGLSYSRACLPEWVLRGTRVWQELPDVALEQIH